MQKLENPVNAPVAFAVLTVQSVGEVPTIILGVDEVRRPVSDAPGAQWATDKSKLLQRLTFADARGESVTIEGIVPEDQAVAVSGCFKCVLEVRPSNRLRAAFAKGSVSKEDSVLEIVQVREVWANASKCIYGQPLGQGRAPSKSMDMKSGAIAAA